MANMMAGLKEKVAGAPLYVWGGGLVLIVLVVAYRRKAKGTAATSTAVPLTDTSVNATGKPTQFYDASGNPITTNGTGYGPPGGAVGPTGPAGAPGTVGARGPAGASYVPPKPVAVKPKPKPGPRPGKPRPNEYAFNTNRVNHKLAVESAAQYLQQNPGGVLENPAQARYLAAREAQPGALLPHQVQPVAIVKHPHDGQAHASPSLQTK